MPKEGLRYLSLQCASIVERAPSTPILGEKVTFNDSLPLIATAKK